MSQVETYYIGKVKHSQASIILNRSEFTSELLLRSHEDGLQMLRSVRSVTKAITGQSQMRGFISRLGAASSFPKTIRPSRSEIQNGQVTAQNLEIAIRSLHQDGLVVVEDAIPHECLDRLNEKMVQDAKTLQARKENSPFNYNPGNIQQDPPPVREYFDSQIFLSRSLSLLLCLVCPICAL
jgi:hypothetical protein